MDRVLFKKKENKGKTRNRKNVIGFFRVCVCVEKIMKNIIKMTSRGF